MNAHRYDYHYLPHRPRPSEGRAVLVFSIDHEPFSAIVASWSREWAARVEAWRATGTKYGLLWVELARGDDAGHSAVALFSAADLDGLRDAACELCEYAGDLSVDTGYFQASDCFQECVFTVPAVEEGFAMARKRLTERAAS